MESKSWVELENEMMDDVVKEIRIALNAIERKKVVKDSCANGLQEKVYTGNDDQEEEPVVIDIEKLQADILKNFKENKSRPFKNKDKASITHNNITNLSSYRDKVTSDSNLCATPVFIVQKVKISPPDAEIADAFFELCMVAACKNRDFMTKYMQDNMEGQPFYNKFSAYLNRYYFCQASKTLVFNHLNLIGNLLLCYVPDYYSDFIPYYREKLGAKNMFDANIKHSRLSYEQKEIMKKRLQVCSSRENAKLCGFVMCEFMVGCIKNNDLPNIDFLTEESRALTTEEKNMFITSNL